MVHARYAIFALTVTVTYVTMNLTLKFTITQLHVKNSAAKFESQWGCMFFTLVVLFKQRCIVVTIQR